MFVSSPRHLACQLAALAKSPADRWVVMWRQMGSRVECMSPRRVACRSAALAKSPACRSAAEWRRDGFWVMMS